MLHIHVVCALILHSSLVSVEWICVHKYIAYGNSGRTKSYGTLAVGMTAGTADYVVQTKLQSLCDCS